MVAASRLNTMPCVSLKSGNTNDPACTGDNPERITHAARVASVAKEEGGMVARCLGRAAVERPILITHRNNIQNNVLQII